MNLMARFRAYQAGGEIARMADQVAALVQQNTFYPVSVPDGEMGRWRIYTVKVIDAFVDNVKRIADDLHEGVVSPGIYKVLSFLNAEGEWEVMMSNTQLEYRTNVKFIEQAHGDVLISGLGLGMLLNPLASKKEVKSITVIEKELEVIALVAPHYRNIKKLRVIHADAFEWTPDRRFDCVMHDIWPNICPTNLPQMEALRRKYAPHAAHQTCWSEVQANRNLHPLLVERKVAIK